MTKKIKAFDAALGLPMGAGEPTTVSKEHLDKLNLEIKDEHGDVLRYHQEAAQVASLFAKRAIRPDEIAALRRRMFETVSKGLAEVDQVISGTKTWTPTQTRLFAILTERVMPKLSNITVEDNTSKKLEEMSIEELETIALGKKKAGAVDAVMLKAEGFDEQAEKFERTETKRTVLRELAYVDALGQAEQEYIARQVSRPMAEIAEDAKAQALKPQPKFTDEQLANVRAARKVSNADRWRAQGFSEEEIVAKTKERLEKIAVTKAQLKSWKMTRMAVKQGLDDDARDVAKKIRNVRNKTLAEFKVHSSKGIRRPTKLAKDAQLRVVRKAAQDKRDLSPRIMNKRPIEGVPDEELPTLTLDRLRELRPDLFVADEFMRYVEKVADVD
jgi:hypothetical protein